jgi:hypothetical protein
MTSAADEPDERKSLYYQGSILRLLRGSETGVVRSASGRELIFVFRHVEMRGPVRRFAELREGMRVGFDVGWTSSGLRVTVIHVDSTAPSQRQPGAEEEITSQDLADGGAEDGDIE